jgi:hypothetical protein
MDQWQYQLNEWQHEIDINEAYEKWMHGYELGDHACALVHLQSLEETPFEVKSTRDKRREKTRDYRRHPYRKQPVKHAYPCANCGRKTVERRGQLCNGEHACAERDALWSAWRRDIKWPHAGSYRAAA